MNIKLDLTKFNKANTEINKLNQEALKDAREISGDYARIIEVRQELSKLADKVKELDKITPDDFVELASQIVKLSYVLSGLEVERAIEERYRERLNQEWKKSNK